MPNDEHRSMADIYDAIIAEARRQQGPPAPRGDLEDEALHEGLRRLAAELYGARARAGLRQQEVAASMGTSASVVSRMECGRRYSPSVSTIMRFARAVGCEVEIRLVPRIPGL